MSATIITKSGDLDVKDVTLVLDTNAYADNDVLVIPQQVHGVFREAGETRWLRSVVLLDESDQGQDIDLVFLDADATLGTINSAVSITDADARKVLGVVSILAADYSDLVGCQVATKSANLLLKAASTQAGLWIAAICRSGTPTYGAAGVRLKLGFG